MNENQAPQTQQAAPVAVPAELSDERIDFIADTVVKGMPDGISGFLKSWGWRQFARAILQDCAGHCAASPQAAPAQPQQAAPAVDVLRIALGALECTAADQETYFKDSRGDNIGPAIDAVTKALTTPPQQAPAPADKWTVTAPDGSIFSAETPLKAAVLANRYRIGTDPVAAKQFMEGIESIQRENEAENARLLAEHGSLDCPACGGSGHIGDYVELPATPPQGAPAPQPVGLTDEPLYRKAKP